MLNSLYYNLIYHISGGRINCINQGNSDDGHEMRGNVEEKDLLTDDGNEYNDEMDALSEVQTRKKIHLQVRIMKQLMVEMHLVKVQK